MMSHTGKNGFDAENLMTIIKIATGALPLIFTVTEKLSKQHGLIHDSVPACFGVKRDD